MSDFIKRVQDLEGLNIYEQYKDDPVYFKFFQVLKEYIFEKYFQDMETYYNMRFPTKVDEAFNVSNKETQDTDNYLNYLLYYYTHFFGFYSPLGKAGGNVLYDDNELWDSNIEWDDINGNGFIPIKDYVKIIKYFMDYRYGSWTYGWLYSFIQDYCKTNLIVIEPDINGCVVHAVMDSKQKLKILSNIFTNTDIYTFTPIQRVKFNIVYSEDELQKEIDRIKQENPPISQNPDIENPPTEKPQTELILSENEISLYFDESIEIMVTTNAESFNVINLNEELVYVDKKQNSFIIHALKIVGNASIEVSAIATNALETRTHVSVHVLEKETEQEPKQIYTYWYDDNPNNKLPISNEYSTSGNLVQGPSDVVPYFHYFVDLNKDENITRLAQFLCLNIDLMPLEILKQFKFQGLTGIHQEMREIDYNQPIEKIRDDIFQESKRMLTSIQTTVNPDLSIDTGDSGTKLVIVILLADIYFALYGKSPSEINEEQKKELLQNENISYILIIYNIINFHRTRYLDALYAHLLMQNSLPDVSNGLNNLYQHELLHLYMYHFGKDKATEIENMDMEALSQFYRSGMVEFGSIRVPANTIPINDLREITKRAHYTTLYKQAYQIYTISKEQLIQAIESKLGIVSQDKDVLALIDSILNNYTDVLPNYITEEYLKQLPIEQLQTIKQQLEDLKNSYNPPQPPQNNEETQDKEKESLIQELLQILEQQGTSIEDIEANKVYFEGLPKEELKKILDTMQQDNNQGNTDSTQEPQTEQQKVLQELVSLVEQQLLQQLQGQTLEYLQEQLQQGITSGVIPSEYANLNDENEIVQIMLTYNKQYYYDTYKEFDITTLQQIVESMKQSM